MPRNLPSSGRQTAAMAEGVRVIAPSIDAKMVVTWATRDGTAAALSRIKASRPILLCGDQEGLLRKTALLHGVEPVLMPRPSTPDAFVAAADGLVLRRGWAKEGDVVLFLLPLALRDDALPEGLYVHRLRGIRRIGR